MKAATRSFTGWAVFIALLAACTAAATAIAADVARPSTVTYMVIPHPDDEFQAWSLIEDDPDDYTVFILLTRGEETGFCNPETYESSGYQPGVELPASPEPTGKWTESCEDARLNSFTRYFTDMSAHDPTIPGDFGQPTVAGPFPEEGAHPCRDDDGVECAHSNATAEVWLDELERGAIVAFDLGDGDLTEAEVVWAVSSVLDDPSLVGVDDSRSSAGVIGTFANIDELCTRYPHPDHVAVHDALWTVDFGAGFQAAATCGLDVRQSLAGIVSDSGAEAAFSESSTPDGMVTTGAHNRNYGWLHQAQYPLDRYQQFSLFHTHQYFWVRFNG